MNLAWTLSILPPTVTGGNMLSRMFQTFFSPATLFIAPEAISAHSEFVTPLVSPWPTTRVDTQNTFLGEASSRNPDQISEPPQLAPFNVKEPGLCLSSPWLFELRILPLSLCRTKLWWNHISATCIPPPCPFGHYPKAHDQRWDHQNATFHNKYTEFTSYKLHPSTPIVVSNTARAQLAMRNRNAHPTQNQATGHLCWNNTSWNGMRQGHT